MGMSQECVLGNESGVWVLGGESGVGAGEVSKWG